ncbi:MAG: proline dehydrogenase family protein [Bacteroidota bacterium]
MGILRDMLLSASRNEKLRESLPRYAFVRRAVKRFMPGEELEDALQAAEALRRNGLTTVVTRLGENLAEEAEANSVADHYLAVLDAIRKKKLDCHVSLKLTQLGLDFNRSLCERHLLKIVRRAHKFGNFVWIDMESSEYVDRTIKIFRKIRARFPNVGVCLQSYLLRTTFDFDILLPAASSIRLVKGTYAEPKDVAYSSKRDVDKNYLNLAQRLIKSAQEHGSQAGIATHDLKLIRKIDASITKSRAARSLYEIQMLYGIKREKQLQLARDGYRVRVLVSYGSFWFPWYMRRLAERPANIFFVLKNLFTR